MWEKRYKSHHDVEKILYKQEKRSFSSRKNFLNFLEKENSSHKLSLYVHTPYCDKICSFCNLNRKQGKKELEKYTEFLCQEIKFYSSFPFTKNSEIDVIFFGGGTPTIYSEEQLEKILKILQSSFHILPNCEFTFESTLHNLTKEKILLLQKYGVNRLSIGIQTFSTRGRKLLNRSFEKEKVLSLLQEIRIIFSGILGIDIIYNYPEQTIEELAEDVSCLSSCNIDSVSFYSLMIQEKSKLSKWFSKNSFSFQYNIQQDQKLHRIFCQRMKENGYNLLELTKFVKKDKYQYIKKNYEFASLLPIGIGAGGRIGNIASYHMNSKISFYLEYSQKYIKKYKLLGLFQFPIISEKALQSLSGTSYKKIRQKMNTFIEKNYFEFQNGEFFYTIEGIFWGNNIANEIIQI